MYGKINIFESSISQHVLILLPIAATVFKKDPLNPASGELYRKKILLPGGSREEIDSLKVRHTYILVI